ncbi:MAG: hypothetical protein ACHQ4H_16800 [Ktedonobacterales bacterium]
MRDGDDEPDEQPQLPEANARSSGQPAPSAFTALSTPTTHPPSGRAAAGVPAGSGGATGRGLGSPRIATIVARWRAAADHWLHLGLTAANKEHGAEAHAGYPPRPRMAHVRRPLRALALSAIYAPAVAIVLVGVLSAAGLAGGVVRLFQLVAARQLDQFGASYDRLDIAGRTGFVSAAFLVLVCALAVVAVGCRGHGWWRLYIIPGVPLSAAAVMIFLFAVRGCEAVVGARLGWTASAWDVLSGIALADAVLVAAHFAGIGAGPIGTRRRHIRGRLRSGREAGGQRSAPARQRLSGGPLPVVRFGPPGGTGAPALIVRLSPAAGDTTSPPEGSPVVESPIAVPPVVAASDSAVPGDALPA